MAGELNCATSIEPIGVSSCVKILERLKGFMLTPYSWTMAISDFATQATLQAEIQKAAGSRVIVMPNIFSFEDQSADDEYEESSVNIIKTSKGRYDLILNMRLNQVQINALNSYDNSDLGFIGVDINDNVHTRIINSTTIGAPRARLFVPGRTWGNDGGVGTKARLRTTFLERTDFDSNGKMLNLDFFSLLEPLTPHVLAQVSASATVLVVTVKNKNDGVGKAGLVEADFTLTETDGTDQTSAITGGVVDNGGGQYTITGTGFTSTWILNLVATTAMSIDGVISDGGLSLTVT